MLTRRALPEGRLAALGATPDFHDGPLARLDADGITIDPQAGRPHWHGERLDETWAIDVLWRPRTTETNPVADGGQRPVHGP